MKGRSGILFILAILFTSYSCSFFKDEKQPLQQTIPTSLEIDKLTEAIKKNPNDDKLLYKRSNVYRSMKLDSLALADLYKAIKIDSTKSNYFSAIGDILFEHKDINGSIGWIYKAIHLNPDDAVAHLKIAKIFLYSEEYPKAFTEINTVLRTDVYNAEAYFLKGMCYKNMKDTNKAISSFQTAVQTDPQYVDAHMQLALIYKAKNNPLALQYFENAYRSDSSSMEPLYGQGMFWQDQNKFDEAKKVFRRCILIDKNFEKAYYNTGWMLLQEDSTEKALRQFDMAISVKQDYVEAYFNRGLCQEILEKNDLAIADYNQALTFNPDYEPAKLALVRINKKLKK